VQVELINVRLIAGDQASDQDRRLEEGHQTRAINGQMPRVAHSPNNNNSATSLQSSASKLCGINEQRSDRTLGRLFSVAQKRLTTGFSAAVAAKAGIGIGLNSFQLEKIATLLPAVLSGSRA
jgi:hypothetical protein